MAFVRKKKVKDKEYYQLVESYRDGERVRQRIVLYLGKFQTVDDAVEGWRRWEKLSRNHAESNERAARIIREGKAVHTGKRYLVPSIETPENEQPPRFGMMAPEGWFFSESAGMEHT